MNRIFKSCQGSTLIENVIAIFLLALFSVMTFTVLSSGIAAFGRVMDNYNNLEESYNAIEQGSDSLKSSTASMTFEIDGQTVTIEGEYSYDEEEKLGEFVAD